MRYSIEPRDRIYVKGYGFLSFAKNMGKSLSNNFKTKITSQSAANNNNGNIAGRVNVEIKVPLKYLSKFWRTLEMPLTNYEV